VAGSQSQQLMDRRVDVSELGGLTAKLASGGELYVAFLQLEDRIGHRVGMRRGGIDRPLLTSLESTAEQVWPLSPPLQQCNLQPLADGQQAALLVGMAGRSHWSVSISLDPSRQGWLFDVACRVQQEPEWLGSSYRCESRPARYDSRSAAFVIDPLILTICVDQSPGVSSPYLNIDDDHLAVVQPEHTGPLPSTHRWKYRIAPAG
jgi:hypothetical protein